jgi:peptidoglycan/LPS O-acetylase OafA/YrhL
MKIRSIQGLRGWAIGLVLVYHFQLIPGLAGYLGVDLFFVISGFVITRLVGTAILAGSFSFKSFFSRRASRLFPPLAAMVSITYLALLLIVSPESFSDSLYTGIASLFGVSNAAIHVLSGDYFSNVAEANAFLHTWSLGIEEQIYLMLPVILVLTFKRFGDWRVAIAIFSSMALISISLFLTSSLFSGVPFYGAIFGFYSPVIRFWEFGVGALVWLLLEYRGVRKRTQELSTVVSVLMILLVPLLPLLWPSITREALTVLMVLSAGVAVSNLSHDAKSILTHPAFVFCGDRSYSLYLWHWPVVVVTGFLSNWSASPALVVLGLLITFLCSEVSFKLIETRGRLEVKRGIKSRLTLWALTSAISSVLVLSLNPYLNSDLVMQSKQRSEPTVLAIEGCENGAWCLDGSKVQVPPVDLSQAIYLVGDSSSAMFFSGLRAPAEELGFEVVARTHGSCPGFPGKYFRLTSGCWEYINELDHYLDEAARGVVIVGVTDRYVFDEGANGSIAAEEIVSGLLEFARRQTARGHHVIVLETIPNLSWAEGGYVPELWPRHVREELSIQLLREGLVNPWRRAFTRVESEFQVFQTRNFLCPAGNCKVIEESVYFFADANHITPESSDQFSDLWERALSQAKERLPN